jgi:hypothetical protein
VSQVQFGNRCEHCVGQEPYEVSERLAYKPLPRDRRVLWESTPFNGPTLGARVQTLIRVQILIQRASRRNIDLAAAGSPPFGRRKGDAILIAFNYACERGDLEVAAQLLIEYERIDTSLPLSLIADRRGNPDNLISAVRNLWGRLRASFAEYHAVDRRRCL